MCKCSYFDTFWHNIGVRIAHMGATATTAAENS